MSDLNKHTCRHARGERRASGDMQECATCGAMRSPCCRTKGASFMNLLLAILVCLAAAPFVIAVVIAAVFVLYLFGTAIFYLMAYGRLP